MSSPVWKAIKARLQEALEYLMEVYLDIDFEKDRVRAIETRVKIRFIQEFLDSPYDFLRAVSEIEKETEYVRTKGPL